MGKQPKHSLQFEAHFSADRSSSATTLVSSLPLLEVGAVALEEAAVALTMNVAAGKAGGRFYLDI